MIDKFKKFKLTACCWYAAAVCAFSTFCYIVQFGNKESTNKRSVSCFNRIWDPHWGIPRLGIPALLKSMKRIYSCLFHAYMEFVKWV